MVGISMEALLDRQVNANAYLYLIGESFYGDGGTTAVGWRACRAATVSREAAGCGRPAAKRTLERLGELGVLGPADGHRDRALRTKFERGYQRIEPAQARLLCRTADPKTNKVLLLLHDARTRRGGRTSASQILREMGMCVCCAGRRDVHDRMRELEGRGLLEARSTCAGGVPAIEVVRTSLGEA